MTKGQVKKVKKKTSGCRILRFTNESRGFEYGLMVQNPGGKEKSGWARFGDAEARSHLNLHAGHYALKSRVLNWDQPDKTDVLFTIEKPDGEEVTAQTYTPANNIGGNTANIFSNGKGKTFEFDIPETGDYVLSFYTAAVKNADFVIGMATLDAKSFVETGIQEIVRENKRLEKSGCYDLRGRQISESHLTNGQLRPGLYIIDGRKVVIR